MVLNKKKNKLLLPIILICLVIIIYFLNKKEKFENYDKEILLKEPLNDIISIDINTNNNQSIPKNIYLTWETSDMNKIAPKMKESIELLKSVNNDCNVYIFDKDQRINFIKKYFIKEVVDAYSSLVPGAYQADLWRYCVLYKYGGIYQDIKFQPINKFKYSELLMNDKEYYVRDRDIGGSGIANALLICKSKNRILLKCINKIIDNCNKKYYGISSLEPTGPLLMKNFFTTKEIYDLDMYFYVENKKGNNIDMIIFKDRPILKMYNEYRTDIKQLGKNYVQLWLEKNIYQ
jgi:mannosyltransferase OCH1-like enzyme